MATLEFTQIGKRIYLTRLAKGMSQQELAKGICSQPQISKIEKGEAQPSVPTLFRISERLGVNCYYFIEETPPKKTLKSGA